MGFIALLLMSRYRLHSSYLPGFQSYSFPCLLYLFLERGKEA